MKLALLGDIGLFGNNTIERNIDLSKYDVIKDKLSEFDYVVGNLETPLTDSEKVVGGKSAYIKGACQDVGILKYLGITHVSLANNHMFDYRKKGLEDTIKVLGEQGIEWYGVKKQKAYICSDDGNVDLYGYCCFSTNGKGMGQYVDFLDYKQVKSDIETSERVNHIPLLSIHWGQEHVHYPNYDHVRFSRIICQSHEVIIHGHHPHVIQGIEKEEKSLIAYSLGNFCFDDVYTSKSESPLVSLSTDNRQSFILSLEIKNNHISNTQIIPFEFDEKGYIINNSILNKIEKWSAFLNSDYEEYERRRSEDLNRYLNSRKKMRDIKWYVKRMNIDLLKMIISGFNNKKHYCKHVKEYIS